MKFLMIFLIVFSKNLPKDIKLLITLVNFYKIHVKEFILVMLQVSSLQFYLKWTVLHTFSEIILRFTHFVEHFRLMTSESPD